MSTTKTILRLSPVGLIATAILFAGCVAPAGAGSAARGAGDNWYLERSNDRTAGPAASLEDKRIRAQQAGAARFNSGAVEPGVRDSWYRDRKITFQIERDWDTVAGGAKSATFDRAHAIHPTASGLVPAVRDSWYTEATSAFRVERDFYR